MATETVREIAVIGAGTMGAGIAEVAARAGYGVALHDAGEEATHRGLGRVEASLKRAVEKGKATEEEARAALARIRPAPLLASAVEAADLVIEAVPERFDLKTDLFRAICAHARPEAILASNTSSFSITDLAAATDRPDRFVGMHFFNPVPVMALLEIVRGSATSEATVALARAVGERLGKTCIVVKDSPGFATSRLGIALGNEAMRMVEEGVASPQDIDTAMELGYRHPIGPLKLTDLVGLDVRLAITTYLYERLGTDTFRPPEILRRMVAEGRLGRKVGKGFYDY